MLDLKKGVNIICRFVSWVHILPYQFQICPLTFYPFPSHLRLAGKSHPHSQTKNAYNYIAYMEWWQLVLSVQIQLRVFVQNRMWFQTSDPSCEAFQGGVALSLCRVFLRNDVAERTVVNVAVVFIARANVAVAL